MTVEESTKIMKALGDEIRGRIFDMLKQGKMCACKLQECFDITQPTLSHHMKILCDSNIVLASKEGKWVYYSINCAKLNELIDYMGNAVCRKGNKAQIHCCKG